MKKKFIIAISMLSLLLVSFSAQAQGSLTNKQKRQMNSAVLDAIEEYEIASQVIDRASKYRFDHLFTDSGVQIFCDLYNNDAFLSNISVSEYSNFMLDNTSDAEVHIQNVRKGRIASYSGAWHYTVTLSKSLLYVDENEVLFPTKEDDATPFNLEITYVFSDDLSSCLIEKITCLNEDYYEPLHNLYIVQKHYDAKDAERDAALKIGGKTLAFNSFKQAEAPKGDLSFWDGDVKLEKEVLAETSQYEYIQVKYTPRHFRAKLRASYAVNGALELSTNTSFKEQATSGYEAGFDFGYSWSLKSGAKFILYTGLAVSNSTLDLVANGVNYSYRTTDPLSRVYTRRYDITSAFQGVTFMDLCVPIYGSLEFKLAKGLSMFVDLGVKGYFNANAKVDPFHLEGSVSGFYSNGSPVPAGTYGIGSLNQDCNDFIAAVAFKRNPIDLTAMANAGFNIAISGPVYLEAKAGYEMGLTQSYKSSETSFYDERYGFYPVVYSATAGKDVIVRPLADCVSFSRKAIWATLGLMIKF